LIYKEDCGERIRGDKEKPDGGHVYKNA
jgi:hypothetical protein